MPRNTYNRREGDISALSNELEFHLQNAQVPNLLQQNGLRSNPLELTGEVNQLDTVELMISMTPDITVLNQLIPQLILDLSNQVQSLGGEIYAGSSLLRNTSDREPAWYRSTSLSETLARGFLNSGSQQLVIGIAREGRGDQSGEAFGISLYNYLRELTPVVLGISASSPYIYRDNQLIDSGSQSYRPGLYKDMSARLPNAMFETPILRNLEDYHRHLQTASDEVNQLLHSGQLDANMTELYRDRNGSPYAPFETLDPHQIYSWIRLRPDHANEDSVFSLEMRIADLPNRVETIQMINSFVTGLAYYASRCGFSELYDAVSALDTRPDVYQQTLLSVAQSGLETQLYANRKSVQLKNILPRLFNLSIQGLHDRNIDTRQLEMEFERLLQSGNEATNTRRFVESTQANAVQLQDYLITRLLTSLVAIN